MRRIRRYVLVGESVFLEVGFKVSEADSRPRPLPPLGISADQEVTLNYCSSAVSGAMLLPCLHHDDNGLTLGNCKQSPN